MSAQPLEPLRTSASYRAGFCGAFDGETTCDRRRNHLAEGIPHRFYDPSGSGRWIERNAFGREVARGGPGRGPLYDATPRPVAPVAPSGRSVLRLLVMATMAAVPLAIGYAWLIGNAPTLATGVAAGIVFGMHVDDAARWLVHRAGADRREP